MICRAEEAKTEVEKRRFSPQFDPKLILPPRPDHCGNRREELHPIQGKGTSVDIKKRICRTMISTCSVERLEEPKVMAQKSRVA